MTTDWVQFALKLAENVRAGVREETKQLETLRSEKTKHEGHLAVSPSK